MKKFFLVCLVALAGTSMQAQNVGIGTDVPAAKLDVKATNNYVGQFNGLAPMYMGIFENDIYRGYWGSYSGAAEDVGALVRWLRANAARFGGDPARIFLVGHSAGATHIATYAYLKSLQPAEGTGIAGMVLMSGRYHFDPNPNDPNLKNFQAYFGSDAAQYPARSPINHVKTAAAIPTYLVISEYDNPDLDTQGALLLGALCERDRACPRFTRMERHNHLSMVFQFNTVDDALGREIMEFMRRGR